MNKKLSSALTATTLALLSACGGGGGSSSSGSNTTTPVAITSSNQAQVAQATVASSLAVEQVGVADDSNRAHALAVAPTSGTLGMSVIDIPIHRALNAVFAQRRGGTSTTVHALSASTSTTHCQVSGSYAVTANDNDNSQTFSSGDVVSIAFAQCRDSSADIIDGTVTLTTSQVSNNGSFNGSFAFQHVSVSGGNTTYTINGNVSLGETESDTTSVYNLTVGNSGLTVAVASNSSTGYSDTLTYESGMAIVETDLSNETQLTLNGSFDSTLLQGHVTLQTLAPIIVLGTNAYPSSGQLKVTGANGSVLLLTAASDTQLRLQLDAQGDTVYEGDTLMNWSSVIFP